MSRRSLGRRGAGGLTTIRDWWEMPSVSILVGGRGFRAELERVDGLGWLTRFAAFRGVIDRVGRFSQRPGTLRHPTYGRFLVKGTVEHTYTKDSDYRSDWASRQQDYRLFTPREGHRDCGGCSFARERCHV